MLSIDVRSALGHITLEIVLALALVVGISSLARAEKPRELINGIVFADGVTDGVREAA